jgi:hypothetical protein
MKEKKGRSRATRNRVARRCGEKEERQKVVYICEFKLRFNFSN